MAMRRTTTWRRLVSFNHLAHELFSFLLSFLFLMQIPEKGDSGITDPVTASVGAMRPVKVHTAGLNCHNKI